MAIPIKDFDGTVDPVSSDYPSRNIKDNTGSNNGTRMNVKAFSDVFQFFAKLMRLAGITYNGFKDNEYTGFQLVTALKTFRYKSYVAIISQSSTADPTATVIDSDFSGPIVLTRAATGQYHCTLSAAFTVGKFMAFYETVIAATTVTGFVKVTPINSSFFEIISYDFAGNQADGILDRLQIEIRVYN